MVQDMHDLHGMDRYRRAAGQAPNGTQRDSLPPIPEIARKLPPVGEALDEVQADRFRDQLQQLEKEFVSLSKRFDAGDVGALLKGVRLALEFKEFYKPADGKKAERVLEEAAKRLGEWREGKGSGSWTTQKGPVVRGFLSKVDGSYQPYGIEIPTDYDLSPGAKKGAAILWLHGRGDTETDMHFIDARMRAKGQVPLTDLPIIHAFGRQCIGFKSAGETDVIEALDHAIAHYPIDPNRVLLMGFSMGGAGAWHLGAHYTDRWVAISPGAGFAETARYQNLKEDRYPPNIEQVLWGVYDVPSYVCNLFNRPVIAYSGEEDKQIQAALVMAESFSAEGRKLDHRIGPGMGHKYHPDVLAQMLQDLKKIANQPKEPRQELWIQTRTLRYARFEGLEIEALKEHWIDSRIEAKKNETGGWDVKTKNIRSFSIDRSAQSFRGSANVGDPQKEKWTIDGQPVSLLAPGTKATLLGGAEGWRVGTLDPKALRKRPKLQGPMDDAFLDPFLVVIPSQASENPYVERWIQFELEHLRKRWKSLYRADLPEVRDLDVTESQMRSNHLVLFGDYESNKILQRMLQAKESHSLPLTWTKSNLAIGKVKGPPDKAVPAMIYPNPFVPEKYVVVNSGPTFREGHDRTNSLQNPKLGDWASLGLRNCPMENFQAKSWPVDFSTRVGNLVRTGMIVGAWDLPSVGGANTGTLGRELGFLKCPKRDDFGSTLSLRLIRSR